MERKLKFVKTEKEDDWCVLFAGCDVERTGC